MHTLRYKIGQYQKLCQVAYVLGRGPRWQPISLSSVNADSKGKEEDTFGSLESNPTSQFYERGREKRYDEDENVSNKLHFRRKAKFQDERRQNLFHDQKAFPFATEYKSSFDETLALDKWNELKQNNIQNLSKNLVEDDREEEYFWHYSHEPKHKGNIHKEVRHNKEMKEKSQKVKVESAVEPQQDSSQFIKPLSPPLQGTLNDVDDPSLSSFGTLSPQKDLYEEEEGDEGDERQRQYEAAKLERRHTPAYYGNKMKQLCKERKLVNAFKILEEEMPSVGAKPDHYCYQVLINACGRAGYTKKAFQLFNDMKKRGLIPQPVAYTGLFNACAESPWPTRDGLTRAHKLREQLREKGYILNQTISHAMIKAFGRCGDIKTAFQIVDEMLEQGLLVTTETICFMLQACISDKENGFRHALLVWRKMRELRLMPTIYAYNLLMRCVGSCGAGDPALTTQLLETGSEPTRNTLKISKENLKKRIDKPNIVSTETNETDSIGDKVKDESVKKETSRNLEGSSKLESELEILAPGYKLKNMQTTGDASMEVLPNLLGRRITRGCAVGLTSLDKPENRLALLGGPIGIFRQMERDKVAPDLATATQLIDALPSNTEAEESLLQSMKNIGLTPDTQFCNRLILKRCFRSDIDSAKDVLILMQKHHLLPDIITFGCLAHGCKTLYLASDLLRDMNAAGFRPNLEIFTTLVKHGISRDDYFFLIRMLQEMSNANVAPDKYLLDRMEKARLRARDLIIKMESRTKNNQDGDRRKFENAELFLIKYKFWLKSSGIELQDHPWAQYKYAKSNALNY